MGSNLKKAFQIIEENNEKRKIKILPLWEKVSLDELRLEN